MKVLLKPSAMLAALEAVSTDETRAVLNGVFLEPDGTLVSTDGHCLIHIPHLADNPENFPVMPGLEWYDFPEGGIIVPTKAMKEAATAAKKIKSRHLPILGHVAVMKGDDGRPCFVSTDLDSTNRTTFRTLEGPYPNYPQVIPRDDDRFEIGVSAALLSSLLKAAMLHGADHITHCVTLSIPKTPVLPIMLYASTADQGTVFALQMPLRIPDREEGEVSATRKHIEKITQGVQEMRENMAREREAQEREKAKLEFKAKLEAPDRMSQAASNFLEHVTAERQARERWPQLSVIEYAGTIETTPAGETIERVYPVNPQPARTAAFGPPAALRALVAAQG